MKEYIISVVTFHILTAAWCNLVLRKCDAFRSDEAEYLASLYTREAVINAICLTPIINLLVALDCTSAIIERWMHNSMK